MKGRISIGIILLVVILSTCNWIGNPFGFGLFTPELPPQWGMFGRNPRHTNNINTPDEHIVGPQGPEIRIVWSYEIDGQCYGAPSIGNDGTIYFGTYRASGDPASFYALNPDGTLKWRYQPFPSTWATPAIADDGTIYCGSFHGGLYAFTPEGDLKWVTDDWRILVGQVIGSDGTIYYTSASGGLKAITPDNSVKWQIGNAEHWTCPVISKDGIIYCQRVGGKSLIAVDPAGNILWEYADESMDHCFSCTVDQYGDIYLASENYYFKLKKDGTLAWKKNMMYQAAWYHTQVHDYYSNNYINKGSSIRSFDSSGTLRWELECDNHQDGIMTIDSEGNLYVGAGELPSLISVSKNGCLLWSFEELEGFIFQAPVISRNGTLYFGFASGGGWPPKFYALR